MKNIYDERNVVVKNFIKILKDRKYTKKSFCELAGISRPTLDLFLKAEGSNSNIFNQNASKFCLILNINEEELLKPIEIKDTRKMICSDNSPINHELTPKAKEQFAILDSICNLYNLYF